MAIVVMRDEDASFSRVVATFLPSEAECSNSEMAECIDGELTSASGDAGIIQGDTIHFGIDGENARVYITLGSDEYELEIRKLNEVSKALVT